MLNKKKTTCQTYIQVTLEHSGAGAPNPCAVKNSCITFWLPKYLTTDRLLLIGRLANEISSWLMHILYVTCIMHYIHKISKRKENY